MTAVAPPVSFQPSTRIGWTSNGNTFGAMSSEEVSRMFTPAVRKTIQRQNSSSSISSTNSNSSTSSTQTITATAPQTNGASTASTAESGNWAAQRKKPARGNWLPGKAEPATGVTTARPQTVNTTAAASSASSAMSALHAPLLPSQQMSNGTAQTNGARSQVPAGPPVILHLTPMNHTFERKTITVPYLPDVLRIGRQTNQKTIPTPTNGFFDSKVLSRQHAEIYADPAGRIYIKDVKSSNGTFVNGVRLSQENKESEPRELKEQDMLELGIDIVSEDQKTVVHHKVAAKVEHAGIYGQGQDTLNLGELDPSGGSGIIAAPNQLRRNGSQGSLNGRALNGAANQAGPNMGVMGQPQHMRNWLNPVTTDQIMKKLNAELRYAMQQSQELARARQSIESVLNGKVESSPKDSKPGSEKLSRPSPIKSKTDLKAHFSEPPAPPPSAPLPEKPDVARALADPVIQPILRRLDTAKPSPSADSSPTRRDHSSDILRLCEELKQTKGQLSAQNDVVKNLEKELAQERTARESAEERAQRLEQGERRDSTRDISDDEGTAESDSGVSDISEESTSNLQIQLDKLRNTMDEMKQQMESYRQRADQAEAERDEARSTLAEMVEQKRRENAEAASTRSTSRPRRPIPKSPNTNNDSKSTEINGHAISPAPTSPTSDILLERAGVEEGQPITPEQAKILTQFLSQEVLQSAAKSGGAEGPLVYHGRPIASAAVVVLVGVVMMTWMNGWARVER